MWEELEESVIYQDIFQIGWQKGWQEGWQQGYAAGLQQGIEIGMRQALQRCQNLVLRLLEQRCGKISVRTRKQISQLPLAQLTDLGVASPDFNGKADLLAWLARQQHNTEQNQ